MQGIFQDPELQAPSTLYVVEVHLPEADAARGLRTIARAERGAEENGGSMK